jgi:branched-chain amino acid aminotransferase
MSTLTSNTWLNGHLRPSAVAGPSIGSISLHIGTGVFDGIMAYWNRDHYYLHRVQEHLERLRAGAEAMSLELRWSTAELQQAIVSLLSQEPPADYYIRPIAHRRDAELTITGADRNPADLCIFGVPVARDCDAALDCCLSGVQRVSSLAMPTRYKVSGMYVNSYLCRREAEVRGFHDGIMLDRAGHIAEASAANIFFCAAGSLVTPELTPEILDGITRQVVLELAAEFGIPVVERAIAPDELNTFEAAFLCSTLMEIRSIGRIEGIGFASAHPGFLRIREGFRQLTHG